MVVQVNTAGMDALTPVLLEALEAELSPTTIVLKNDSPVRELEGLKREVMIAKGELGEPIELIENDAKFVADLSERPEDRLVLRPARQPPLHGAASPRMRACSMSIATAAASACWRRSAARSR